jgi:hypothetical protein
MHFKLIMAMVADDITDDVMKAAREAGATGCSVLPGARGEGLEPEKTFFGLDLSGQRDLVMFLVAEELSRDILETIASVGKFDENPGAGIAFQLDIEDAVGLGSQLKTISEEIADQI